MKTDVQVTVTGLPFSSAGISGISISYGVNSMPTASLELDACYIQKNAPAFLCNPDKYKVRSKAVSITVKTKTGCLYFDGFFDGLSVSQSVGSLTYTATIRSVFQRLLEIYPRTWGVCPSSFNIFTDPDQLKVQHGNPLRIFTAAEVGAIHGTKTDGTIPKFIIDLVKVMINTQFDSSKNVSPSPAANDILKLMQDSYLKNLNAAKELINRIDLTYVNDCAIQSAFSADMAMQLITSNQFTDLWSMLVNVFNYLGCCLVVGNRTVTVLPETKFLKFDHPVPKFQSTIVRTNCADPGQYNSFSTSDTGRVNIKAVYVTTDTSEMMSKGSINMDNPLATTMGVYPPNGGKDPEIPDDGADGILIVNAPAFFLTAMNGLATTNPKAQASQLAQNPPFIDRVYDPRGITTIITATTDSLKKANVTFETLRNQYAKLKFLQSKYEDRVGQLTTYFNPHWVPGTSGSLYMRLPGSFKQFYVTNVHHVISMKSPNSGTAVTSVSFCSVRQGTYGNIPGVTQDDLFQYDQTKMKQFQASWLKDTSSPQ